MAQVASVLVDTAKVEVDYLKATGQSRAGFLEEPPQVTTGRLPGPASPFPTHDVQDLGAGRTVHRLRG